MRALFPIIGCLSIGVAFAFWAHLIERRHYRIIARRTPLSEAEWEVLFFPGSAQPSNFALLALDTLARRLGVSRLQLRPSDRFDQELRPKHWLILDSDVDLFSIELERLCREWGVPMYPFSADTVALGPFVAELARRAGKA
jgi:hypothetical protein